MEKPRSKESKGDQETLKSLVRDLRESMKEEILSRGMMRKLIEAELFQIRADQKELVGQFRAIDLRVAKMIDYLNTFPAQMGKVVVAALQGRGWGNPISADAVTEGIEFLRKGMIKVAGSAETPKKTNGSNGGTHAGLQKFSEHGGKKLEGPGHMGQVRIDRPK